MKKTLLTILSVAFGMTVLITPALAASTVSFSPTSINAAEGQDFNIMIAIDPQSVNNYTAKIELNYPTDILEVKSFTLESEWMAITQSGYDLIDNTNGVLIKTAGYPGGISSAKTFGTVSFSAKKAGNGIIKLGNGGFILDANSQNILSGTASTPVVITAPVVAQKPIVSQPTTETQNTTPTTETTPTEQVNEQPSEQVNEQPTQQASLLGAIGNMLALGTNNSYLGTLVGLMLLGAIAYAVYFFKKKQQPKI